MTKRELSSGAEIPEIVIPPGPAEEEPIERASEQVPKHEQENSLEPGIEFLNGEIQSLMEVAVKKIKLSEHSSQAAETRRRVMARAQSRIGATVMAITSLFGAMSAAPSAEAGGRHPLRPRIGMGHRQQGVTFGSRVFAEGNRIMYQHYVDSVLAANEAGYAHERIQQEGEQLLRRYDELAQTLQRIGGEIEDAVSHNWARRVDYLHQQEGKCQREMDEIRGRLGFIDDQLAMGMARGQEAESAVHRAAAMSFGARLLEVSLRHDHRR